MSALARLPGLDGLRGVAVLAVIGYHLNLGNFLPAGFLGVDIFFTVSGFIITALLLQEHARAGRIDSVGEGTFSCRARRLQTLKNGGGAENRKGSRHTRKSSK